MAIDGQDANADVVGRIRLCERGNRTDEGRLASCTARGARVGLGEGDAQEQLGKVQLEIEPEREAAAPVLGEGRGFKVKERVLGGWVGGSTRGDGTVHGVVVCVGSGAWTRLTHRESKRGEVPLGACGDSASSLQLCLDRPDSSVLSASSPGGHSLDDHDHRTLTGPFTLDAERSRIASAQVCGRPHSAAHTVCGECGPTLPAPSARECNRDRKTSPGSHSQIRFSCLSPEWSLHFALTRHPPPHRPRADATRR
eukprot:2710549-Rhodomonas_salina.1